MAQIELRIKSGTASPEDLLLSVQAHTYDYLLISPSEKIRISAFLDRDYSAVARTYSEVFIHESCEFETKVEQVIPGSRVRKKITLPGPMQTGEQLTILVVRTPKAIGPS